ncbi:hypothetical protein ATE71_15980 [Sphingopyxis sp. H115]|nr:hypothetical protein ATE71_15980 [Sphingopyxis sp. H115]
MLDWIVRQAECDVATALTIFWRGQPACWIGDAGSTPDRPNGFSYLNRRICAYIANRIGEGGYPRSKIAYAPDTWTKKDYVDLAEQEKRLDNPLFRTHPDLIHDRNGRTIENDAAFYARQDFHHSFDCELPGDTPRSDAVMERVGKIERAMVSLLPSWLRR